MRERIIHLEMAVGSMQEAAALQLKLPNCRSFDCSLGPGMTKELFPGLELFEHRFRAVGDRIHLVSVVVLSEDVDASCTKIVELLLT